MSQQGIWLTTLLVIVLPVVDGKIPDLATLCPYNDFCTTKATKTLRSNETDLMPCCQKCSCEPDCQLFGNCCPDKDLTPDVQVKYPCVSLDDYYNKPRGMVVLAHTNDFFHVIDDCPNLRSSYNYPRCSAPSDLEDYVFVSDSLTGRVYKNKDCARCNGVQQFAKWSMSTECISESEGLTREEWFAYVLRSCTMTPILTDKSVSQNFRCFPNVDFPKTCNITGTWEEADIEIKEACESENLKTNALYYHETFNNVFGVFTVNYYQNAFCKLCNPQDDDDVKWSELCTDALYGYGKKSSMGILVLLNFRKEEENSMVSRCKQEQIWDPYQDSCMNVVCPVSSFLQGGKCEDLYERILGQTYVLYFRVMTHQDESILNTLEDMHNVITSLLNNRNCHQCYSQLLTNVVKPDDFHIMYQLKTTEGCTHDYLIKRVSMLKKKPHSFHQPNLLKNITLVLNLFVIQRDFEAFGEKYKVNNCPAGILIDQKMIDRCPRIHLTYASFNAATRITLETEKDGTLCLHEYFEIMQSKGISNHYKNIVLIIILTKSLIMNNLL